LYSASISSLALIDRVMFTVLQRTAFDFTTLSAGQSRKVMLGRLCGLPARAPFRLAVRVHALDFGVGGTSAELRICPAMELPGSQSWFATAEPWLKVVVNETHAAPRLLIAASSHPLPPSVCAELIGTYVGTLGGTATLSAELVV
jgi:hypothetical protein